MKRYYSAILLICAAIVTFNCQKEIDYLNYGLSGAGKNPVPIKATLQGNIIDENDLPAENVTIHVGDKTVTTNGDGYFRIVNASLDKNAALVIAEKAGYFKGLRSFNATSGANHVMIKLIKKSHAGTIDAVAGGNVTLSNGSIIALPANAIEKANSNNTYTGTVKIYASYIDPTAVDIAQLVPGSFMADDKNNKRVTLASYGMLAIELESTAGEKLQIAPGYAATITVSIPSSLQSSAPATIALWHVDERSGIWKEEGTAVKSGNNYVGEVNHFSFWNCDISVPAVTLSVTLKTTKAVPVVHGEVRLTLTSSGLRSQAYGYTDSMGQVSGLVPAGEPIVLEVLDPCHNVAYSQNIGSLNQNTDLGTITIDNSSSTALIIIEGQLRDCNNLAITDGYAIISCDNVTRYVSVNEKGEFATSFLRCSGSSASCEIIGVDESGQQQGERSTISIVTPVTNSGVIVACGVSATQFINYTLDGVEHSITSTAGDSLTSYTYDSQATPPLFTWIGGMKISGNEYISLRFGHEAATGTYPLNAISVQGFDSVAIVQPSNVVLTNYPSNTGGFYEGSFSGKFKGPANPDPVHNINGSFRIRRL